MSLVPQFSAQLPSEWIASRQSLHGFDEVSQGQFRFGEVIHDDIADVRQRAGPECKSGIKRGERGQYLRFVQRHAKAGVVRENQRRAGIVPAHSRSLQAMLEAPPILRRYIAANGLQHRQQGEAIKGIGCGLGSRGAGSNRILQIRIAPHIHAAASNEQGIAQFDPGTR